MSLFSNKSNGSVDVLSKVLADSYVLLVKTQNIHWNVEGSEFRSIHLMTEEHYNNLFDAIDVIAERIRMIGGKSPATFAEFSKLASFDLGSIDVLNSRLAFHDKVVWMLKATLKK